MLTNGQEIILQIKQTDNKITKFLVAFHQIQVVGLNIDYFTIER